MNNDDEGQAIVHFLYESDSVTLSIVSQLMIFPEWYEEEE
jgi:hypothetical protein